MEKIQIKPETGRYGTLRWYAVPEGDCDRRACFIGRISGLYLHGVGLTKEEDKEALTRRLQGPSNRAALLRTFNRWLEDRPSKNWKRQYSAICIETPGIDAEDLEMEPFDMEGLRHWISWEIDRLDARDCIIEAFKRLWPVADGECFEALGVPKEKFHKWRQMDALVGLDVERCLNESWNRVVDDPAFCERPDSMKWDRAAFNEWFQEPERIECRRLFVDAWKKEEHRLLALTPSARDREYELEGV